MEPGKDEIRMPEEGLSTLVTQFTKRELDRLRKVIIKLRADGKPEGEILGLMKKQLKRFDAHTLNRIYQRSIGEPVADDITPENVVKEEEMKKNTVAVEVKEAVPGLDPQGLVQYKGEEWFVQRLDGKRYILKRVL